MARTSRRTVKIVSSRIHREGGIGLKRIETTASEWGELKSQIANEVSEFEDVDFDHFKVDVKETGATLENNEAELPPGDFKIYIFERQHKGGADDPEIEFMEKIRGKLEKKIANYQKKIDASDDYIERMITTWENGIEGSEEELTQVTAVIDALEGLEEVDEEDEEKEKPRTKRGGRASREAADDEEELDDEDKEDIEDYESRT